MTPRLASFVLPIVLLGLLAAACGGSGGSPSDAAADAAAAQTDSAPPQEDAEPQSDAPPRQDAALACADVQQGHNVNFVVDGLARSFYLDLPTGVGGGGPYPVVFNWHGLGDTAANMRQLLSGQVNNAAYQLILVTPDDSGFQIMGNNVNWEVFGANATTNREARLFDEILACLKTRYSVDEDRVHSVGFSLGSIVSDMLGVIRGDQLASVLTFSGAYLSNSANAATLGLAGSMVSWPAPTTTNTYAQVILHGGTTDSYNLGGVVTVHFDVFAANDQTYLNGLGHDVILCNHGQGHTAPGPGFGPAQVVEFLKDHPRGTVTSPYASALPGDFPSYCSYHAHQ
jgi:poly(3-hydroxybutyrate) depolymerase